jgi:hypothetical protein
MRPWRKSGRFGLFPVYLDHEELNERWNLSRVDVLCGRWVSTAGGPLLSTSYSVKRDLSPLGTGYLSDWIWMVGQCRRCRRTTRAPDMYDATMGVNLDLKENVNIKINKKKGMEALVALF